MCEITNFYEYKYCRKKYIINIYDIGFLVISNATVEILAPKNANITIKEGHYHGL